MEPRKKAPKKVLGNRWYRRAGLIVVAVAVVANLKIVSKVLSEFKPILNNFDGYLNSNSQQEKETIDQAPIELIQNISKLARHHRPTKDLPEYSKVPFLSEVNHSLPLWAQRSLVKERAFYRVQQPVNDPQPRAPIDVIVIQANQSKASLEQYPTLAVVTSTKSTDRRINEQTLLANLIQSLEMTISTTERRLWNIKLFVAIDESDGWWRTHWKEHLMPPSWMEVVLGVFTDRPSHVPFNEIAYLAYNMSRPDYYCRVNDDSQFDSINWLTFATQRLLEYNPPNVGVAAPLVEQGNTLIHTHDFVHATHMEIHAGNYYPPGFGNWWLDDWITFVYHKEVLGFHRSMQVKGWTMTHHTGDVWRYTITGAAIQNLPFEYELGQKRIYAKIQQISNMTLPTGPTAKVPNCHQHYKNVMPIVAQVTGLGNLLVFGLLDSNSVWLHKNIPGKVFIIVANDTESRWSFHFHQYLERVEVPYNQDLYEKENATLEKFTKPVVPMDDWKSLELPWTAPELTGVVQYNAIWVEAPLEDKKNSKYVGTKGPAVFQPLYMSSRVAFNQAKSGTTTHIFVNSYQKTIENRFSLRVLGKEPSSILERTDVAGGKIAHFVIGPDDLDPLLPSTSEPPPATEAGNLGALSHNNKSLISESLTATKVGDVVFLSHNNTSNARSTALKIVILSMDRFKSLTRLVDSLRASDYLGDRVDLVIRFDRPKNVTPVYDDKMQQFRANISWPFGSLVVKRARASGGLRKAWLEAWRPNTTDERAIIFEDDITVSKYWYKWWKGANEAYKNRTDVAAISLQRQTLIPLMEKRSGAQLPDSGPFLYSLVGSIGFAPKPSMWLDFLDFANCTLSSNMPVVTSELITSDWYETTDKTAMWTQLYIFFSKYNNHFVLYNFPKQERALAAHWREKGEHFADALGSDFALAEESDIDYDYPTDLPMFDWGAQKIEHKPKFAILSVALGYSLPVMKNFVSSARKHFDGDIWLIIADDAPEEVTSFLQRSNVKSSPTSLRAVVRSSPEWSELIRSRWQTFAELCSSEYDLCLTADFRDVVFQSNPFVNMTVRDEPQLNLFAHNLVMNPWHIEESHKCGNGTAFEAMLKNQMIINAGAMIASPSVFSSLSHIINERLKCSDDQVALNVAVYGNMIPAGVKVSIFKQGFGSVNNLGWGGVYQRDERGRILNHNCLVSPAYHQLGSENFV